jgi:hypothetical protein
MRPMAMPFASSCEQKFFFNKRYAVMSFGGFLGLGAEEHAVPWSKLTYDTNLGGYRTDLTEQQLQGAPAFSRDGTYDFSDRDRERELHDYYRAPYYW